MKQGYLKKVGSLLLTSAMILTMFSTSDTKAHAEENRSIMKEQFATMDELETFNTNDDDGEINPAKIYFGDNNQQWWIVGSQSDNSVVLFAVSPLMKTKFNHEPYSSSQSPANKTYDSNWGCTYPGGEPEEVYPNHYGASLLRTELANLVKSYFSSEEQKLMNDTTIYTEDSKNNSVYSTTEKLYAAFGNQHDTYVTAGANISSSLDEGLRIDRSYWGNCVFWLRTTYSNASYRPFAFTGAPNSKVDGRNVGFEFFAVPAFELNTSNVLFGSTVPTAAANGQQSINDAMTLRYKKDIGTAKISTSKQSVSITDVADSNTYLVIQNSDGAWAKKVTNNDVVFASEMNEDLTSFDNCKVWLESADTTSRMTYATMAAQATGHNVKINVGDTMTVSQGNNVQADITENIADIVITAKDDYMFPADYAVAQQNGITVTRNSQNQLTVSGTPTNDVNITLPAATKKIYSMTVTGNGTFTTVCKDYQPMTAKEFTITNHGNIDLENVNVSLIGSDVDKFELIADNTTTIQPTGTIKVTVKPKDALAVGTYQAKLSVSADKADTIMTDLQFTVSEHDYNTVVTPPTCTDKGYTTYTCKNCKHSYVGDEAAAKGHTFGEWEIIGAPTCEQGGSRKHICKDCGYEETETLTPTGHVWEDDYTVDKEPTCTENGSKSIHCKNCDAVKESTIIAKLGHSFTNYVSDGNATCTKDGTKTAKCDRCDETETVVDTGTMLEHEYEWVYNNDAACEKNGTETGTCRHCKTTVTREKVGTALGHEFKNYVSDDNATCTENGTETAKCERCDKTDTRTAENSALGHKLGEWKVIKEATTTETGEKERACERCDYKETEVIPMLSKEEQPTTPAKPDKGDNSSNEKNSTVSKADRSDTAVKTGDDTNIFLWSMATVISLAGVIAALSFKRRRSR